VNFEENVSFKECLANTYFLKKLSYKNGNRKIIHRKFCEYASLPYLQKLPIKLTKDKHSNLLCPKDTNCWVGSVTSNERELRSCLGQVFNFKLGSFVLKQGNCIAPTQSLLELKTQPRFCSAHVRGLRAQ
jgi:hypothetical protein